jgi:hypothetical protein
MAYQYAAGYTFAAVAASGAACTARSVRVPGSDRTPAESCSP